MAGSNIPDDVRRFLMSAIPTVPHLEALLLLRAEPDASWQPERLAHRLYVDKASARRLLADLAGFGLLQVDADRSYALLPQDVSRTAVIAQLDAIYARHVVEVAELIHSTADRKAQRFADAFRLRKEF